MKIQEIFINKTAELFKEKTSFNREIIYFLEKVRKKKYILKNLKSQRLKIVILLTKNI